MNQPLPVAWSLLVFSVSCGSIGGSTGGGGGASANCTRPGVASGAGCGVCPSGTTCAQADGYNSSCVEVCSADRDCSTGCCAPVHGGGRVCTSSSRCPSWSTVSGVCPQRTGGAGGTAGGGAGAGGGSGGCPTCSGSTRCVRDLGTYVCAPLCTGASDCATGCCATAGSNRVCASASNCSAGAGGGTATGGGMAGGGGGSAAQCSAFDRTQCLTATAVANISNFCSGTGGGMRVTVQNRCSEQVRWSICVEDNGTGSCSCGSGRVGPGSSDFFEGCRLPGNYRYSGVQEAGLPLACPTTIRICR